MSSPLTIAYTKTDEAPALATRSLLPIFDAFRAVHLPASQKEIDAGRRRFIYQELYMLQLALRLHRRQAEVTHRAEAIDAAPHLRSRIEGVFPFPLTQAQRRVAGEILADMARPTPMQRLLQGDVGSGKTAVAVIALLNAALTGHQAVIMAPTELLARQHLEREIEDDKGAKKPVPQKESYEDIIWALFNTKEFLFNH